MTFGLFGAPFGDCCNFYSQYVVTMKTLLAHRISPESIVLLALVFLFIFRTTAEVENFNSLILMYAGKRFSYSPPVYRVRNLLAAIDYNSHVDREHLATKDGRLRYHRLFNKKSARWTVTPVKAEKTFSYMDNLIANVFNRRLNDNIGMQRNSVREANDPREISANISSIPPPCTADLVKEKQSRLQK